MSFLLALLLAQATNPALKVTPDELGEGILGAGHAQIGFPGRGLIAFWKLDGDSVDCRAQITGTDAVMSYGISSIRGLAASFNGISSKITLPNMTWGTGKMSVSAWVKTSYAGGGYQEIFANIRQNPGIDLAGFEFRQIVTQLQLVVGNNTDSLGYQTVMSTRAINSGNWVHVAGTYDGSTLRLYINGVPDGTATWGGGLVFHPTDTRTRIGVNNYFGATEVMWWNGSIDEVGVWDRALSDAEISALYHSGDGLWVRW